MNPAQIGLYRREWGQVRKVLRARGLPPEQADAERHAMHVAALGKDKSSKDFTNTDLNKILTAFRAVIQPPEDLDLALAVDRIGVNRLRVTVRLLQVALDKPDAYIQGIIRQMNFEGRLSDSNPRANLILEDLGESELAKIQVALKIQCRRAWRTKEEILAVIHRFVSHYELDEDATRANALAALGWDTLPAIEKLKYDHLVLIFGGIRPLATSEQPF